MKSFLTVLTVVCLWAGVVGGDSSATAQQVTVAPDGSGQFRTIQAAINSLPDHAPAQRVVLIKKGTYPEKVSIDGKDHITLRGENEKNTIISIAQAREAWLCETGHDDWGVATLNLRNSPDLVLEHLTVENSYGRDAQGDAAVDCPRDPSGKKTVQPTGHQMALRALPGATRLVARHCTFRAYGGDTVSPWDTEAGMYYFQNCTMEGGVDFYCPRGWAYAEKCHFICHSQSAAIWHDGSGHKASKTVLKNCTFAGDDNFKLGRFHREAQFYLIGCEFPKNMADADIYHATSGPGPKQWGRRVYYADCHRKGGDYAWMKDNLATAEGSPTTKQIDAKWAFDGRWNPETGYVAPAETPVTSVATDTVAEKMLVYQRTVGGWPKAVKEEKVDYRLPLTAAVKTQTLADAKRPDATIDNNATTREITYLVKAYKNTQNPAYRAAAERGIRYLLKMQQPSGGFPQFYPDSSSYRAQITYNDNAMISALWILKRTAERQGDYALLSPELAAPAQAAVQRGIGCILKTQYVRNGQLTAWGAQHDRRTLLPCKARAFELASLSGDETVGIVEFLMAVDNPTPTIRKSIEAAVAWLNEVKMPGYALKLIDDKNQPTGKDRIVVPQAGATLWARFYDLDTNKPIYVGRDGVKRANLTDIENERRAGYLYAGNWPEKLLAREYPQWQQKWATK